MNLNFSSKNIKIRSDGSGVEHPPRRRRGRELNEIKSCCSSGVEHFLGKEEVVSSILINSSFG